MFYFKGGTTFIWAPWTGICLGTFEIVTQEVFWSIWGSHQTLWSLSLPNVTWHSGTWPYTMTPSVDQALHQFANLLPNWTLLPILALLPNFGGFHRALQRVRLANRGRLLPRTPGSVPFGTCIYSYVEIILVMSTDLLKFEHPSVLLFCFLMKVYCNASLLIIYNSNNWLILYIHGLLIILFIIISY